MERNDGIRPPREGSHGRNVIKLVAMKIGHGAAKVAAVGRANARHGGQGQLWDFYHVGLSDSAGHSV